MVKELTIDLQQVSICTEHITDLLHLIPFPFRQGNEEFPEPVAVAEKEWPCSIVKFNRGARGHFSKFVKAHLNSVIALELFKPMRLSELKSGERATIHSFESSELELKLMEMGCIPGEEVVVEQIAPLGDPISIRIAGYSLSLRKNEAKQILVDK